MSVVVDSEKSITIDRDGDFWWAGYYEAVDLHGVVGEDGSGVLLADRARLEQLRHPLHRCGVDRLEVRVVDAEHRPVAAAGELTGCGL